MDNKKIDDIIRSACYGIDIPADKRERFLMRRLVEHSYLLGVKGGIDDANKLSKIIGDWDKRDE